MGSRYCHLLIAALMGKQSKGLHMTLRLFYVLIIITGGALFIEAMDYGQGMLYGFKFLGGILVIGMMEMVLVRQRKINQQVCFGFYLQYSY